jgi:hypothetical protein
MVTIEEHMNWLVKHCDIVTVSLRKHGRWYGYAKIGCLEFTVENVVGGAETTRELCDDVCEFLGEDCK